MEIIRVQGEQLAATSFPLRRYAFAPTPEKDDPERTARSLSYQTDATTLVAFDGGRAVGTGTSIPMTQAVRGAVLPMAAVASVATDPAYRRQGVQRQLVPALLAAERAEGRVLSCLYPFRASFYGKFGYVGLPQYRYAVFPPAVLGPLLSMDLPGSVSVVTAAEGYRDYVALQERLQPAVHGLAVRGGAWLGQLRDSMDWIALVRSPAGEVLGGMVYDVRPFERLSASGLFAVDVPTRYVLLQWLARHVDQLPEVQLELAPGVLAENWLFDLYGEFTSRPASNHAPMGRVLDVAGLGGLAGLTVGTGEVCVQVVDPTCRWNEGVFTLASDGGRLAVSPGGADPVELDVIGLSGLVYGGYDPDELAFRGWLDAPPDVRDRLRLLFPPVAPAYLHEQF